MSAALTGPHPARRVLVTRAAHQAGKLSTALRALGFEPVEVPVLEILLPESFEPLDTAIRKLFSVDALRELSNSVDALRGLSNLDKDAGCPVHPQSYRGWVGDHEDKPYALPQPTYDWLILTSANTVRALTARAATLNLTLGSYTGQVAAVGAATATAAREAGLTISLIPETYVAESLIASLADQTAGKRILIARAAAARDIIPDTLRAAGAQVEVVDAYSNAIPASAPAQLRQALEQGIAAATFTSSSSVTHLAEVAEQAGISFPFEAVPAISIGPITTQTLREHNWPPAAEATQSDIENLAAAVSSILS